MERNSTPHPTNITPGQLVKAISELEHARPGEGIAARAAVTHLFARRRVTMLPDGRGYFEGGGRYVQAIVGGSYGASARGVGFILKLVGVETVRASVAWDLVRKLRVLRWDQRRRGGHRILTQSQMDLFDAAAVLLDGDSPKRSTWVTQPDTLVRRNATLALAGGCPACGQHRGRATCLVYPARAGHRDPWCRCHRCGYTATVIAKQLTPGAAVEIVVRRSKAESPKLPPKPPDQIGRKPGESVAVPQAMADLCQRVVDMGGAPLLTTGQDDRWSARVAPTWDHQRVDAADERIAARGLVRVGRRLLPVADVVRPPERFMTLGCYTERYDPVTKRTHRSECRAVSALSWDLDRLAPGPLPTGLAERFGAAVRRRTRNHTVWAPRGNVRVTHGGRGNLQLVLGLRAHYDPATLLTGGSLAVLHAEMAAWIVAWFRRHGIAVYQDPGHNRRSVRRVGARLDKQGQVAWCRLAAAWGTRHGRR